MSDRIDSKTGAGGTVEAVKPQESGASTGVTAKPPRRIGILGGSFDPVHTGHVNLARDAMDQAGLDQVLLIPARLQPFKQDRTPASGEDRMEMLRLALAEDPGISPCDYELTREGVSYTYLTLRAMQERFGPEARIFFIIGTDSLLMLDSWMNAEELLTGYSYIVGSRPGYLNEELREKADRIREKYGTEILWIQNRRFDISATEIREKLAAGAPTDDLVPEPVADYIREHGLYGCREHRDSNACPAGASAGTQEAGDRPAGVGEASGEHQPLREEEHSLKALKQQGIDWIREHLKKTRYEHTLRVRDEAIALANRFGADAAKAETAAIWHDMAKNLPREEINRLIRRFGLDEKYIDEPDLAHSKLAAALMEGDFGVRDQDLLNAVSYHTTGRAGMSLLEKVVFLADAIEAGRSYPAADEIRQIARTDLDLACIRMLERTVAYLEKKGARIDEDTLEALADLKERYDQHSPTEG